MAGPWRDPGVLLSAFPTAFISVGAAVSCETCQQVTKCVFLREQRLSLPTGVTAGEGTDLMDAVGVFRLARLAVPQKEKSLLRPRV